MGLENKFKEMYSIVWFGRLNCQNQLLPIMYLQQNRKKADLGKIVDKRESIVDPLHNIRTVVKC